MKVTRKIRTKYLVFPVNSHLPRKELLFFDGEKQVYELSISLDNEDPTFFANVNVERFIGKEISFEVIPEMKLSFTESDETLYKNNDAPRPKLQFTASSGWTNDPNGLYKYGGEYHLFYQHNPCDVTWANMHWGHAKSRDLLHWAELDEAVFPNENGLIYSGGAFVDRKNASGLKCTEDDPILLYYTAAPRNDCETSMSFGKKWTQRILVSTDGGKSFTERPEYVDEICVGNRDPKVEYVPETDKYVMAIYLKDRDYAFLTSNDLLSWEASQLVTLDGDDECPNFARYKVEGTDEYKWVLYGAHSRYSVYEIRDGKFVEVQASRAPSFATDAYAGQDFPDPDTRRRIKIDWVRAKAPYTLPAASFSQLFGTPVELRLIRDEDGYSLEERPVSEILAKGGECTVVENAKSGTALAVFDEPLIVSLKAKYQNGKRAALLILGRRIDLDLDENKLSSRTCSTRISHNEESVDLTVVCDKYTLEIFSDGGRFYTTSIAASDPNIRSVALTGDTLPDATLTVTRLNV